MLKVALSRAGKVYEQGKSASRSSYSQHLNIVEGPRKANFGKRIVLPKQMPVLN